MRSGLTIVSMVFVCLAGCSSLPRAQTRESAQQANAKLVVPRNLIDVLRNFKVAIDSELLLRDDFYTEENLKRFSGGREITWHSTSGDGKNWGSIAGFDSIAEPLVYGGTTYNALYISFWQEVRDEKGIATRWRLDFHSPQRPDFSDVEAIFGKQWVLYELSVPIPDMQRPRAPTRLHGNEKIIYQSVTPVREQQMRFDFAFDATLEHAGFMLRRQSK